MTSMTGTTVNPAVSGLEARSAAFAVLARMLGPDPAPLLDADLRDRLRDVLADLDAPAARAFAEPDASDDDADELARRWIRWFDHARIPPYEASHVAPTAGGITPRLADIAGFYRAFGVRVCGDRPDHIVAELEFMANVLASEAVAQRRADDGAALQCHEAARAFLRDHLGTWIDVWAARVADEPALQPWAPAAITTARLVALETRLRNVVPLRTSAVLPCSADPVEETDEAAPACAPSMSAAAEPPATW